MPANDFSWLRSFSWFAQSVMYKTRFVLNENERQYLAAVCRTAGKRQKKLAKDDIFFRAAWHHETEQVWQRNEEVGCDELIEEIVCPAGTDRMVPRRQRASEGRVNPKGIPCLYVSSEKETAMSEIRPWKGALITVARFRLRRDARVIDLMIDKWTGPGNRSEAVADPSAIREQNAWAEIGLAFSKPLSDQDDSAEYAPTQYIAEAIRAKGFDGIKFKSSIGSGFNLALFDIDIALCEERQVFSVDQITYQFSSITP